MQHQIYNLQAVRGLAAMAVLLFHVAVYHIPDVIGYKGPIWAGFNAGYAGVVIFFVLSGFIMMLSYGGRKGDGVASAKTFLAKRALRIYPIYWIILVVTIAGGPLTDATQSWPGLAKIIKAVTLYPLFDKPIMGVAWTLSYEMLFYIVFATLLLRRSWGMAVLGVWFGVCAFAFLVFGTTLTSPFLISPYNLLFAFGLIAYFLRNSIPEGGEMVIAVISIAGIVAILSYEQFSASNSARALAYISLGVGAFTALLIPSLAALENKRHIVAPKVLIILGDASYSIYLCHIIAGTIAAKIMIALGLASILPVTIIFIILVVAATLAGVVFHYLIEKPIMQYVAGRFKKAPPILGGHRPSKQP